jgi:hypothetical protein
MAFSCVINPNLAEIHTYFYQLRADGRPEWFMARVSGDMMAESRHVVRLSRDTQYLGLGTSEADRRYQEVT